jgi:formylglycine-generating enzyme required for sulfatase activity
MTTLVLAVTASAARAEVVMDFVPVGNAGNAADTRYSTPGYGAVAKDYQIGKYEVTAGQYTSFLSAVAATDTYGLYNASMWSSDYGCKIQQSGSSGSYAYSVAADRANRPVNYVSFWDAARFVNWLHNGQGGGSTESGAYSNVGQSTFARNADAKYWIPSENEWYKAAYHKSNVAGYWDYPTSSDSINTSMANYGYSPVDNTTDVGAYAYASPYGTFDQGGNVWEWNETAIGSSRGLRGGYWYGNSRYLLASNRNNNNPTNENNNIGFRVASS